MTSSTNLASMSDASDLRAGDILLMYGEGPLSDLIVWASDGAYSHAAMVADAEHLIEASLSGVRLYPLSDRLNDHDNYHYIDAFRYRDGESVGLASTEAEQVLAKALTLLHVPYPLDQLALFGAIMAVRGKWPSDPARLVVRVAFDHLLPSSSNEGMVCSEVVYRAYAECAATPAGRLAPAIVIGQQGSAPFPEIDWKELIRELWPSLLPPQGRNLLQSSVVQLNAVGSLLTADTREAIAPPEVSDAELESERQAVLSRMGVAKALLAVGALTEDGMVDPHPNPRLVSPEDLARSPNVLPLGRLMQRLPA